MAYTINSAKDVASDEQAFVDRFNQNLPEIEAYQRTNGGDLEGAYQKVTGEPWPSGRSVKINNGRAEMTKDRTVKSVLGKYVLPIAAGAVTGGAALGAFGGGAAAAGAGAAGAGSGAGGAGTLSAGAGAIGAGAGVIGRIEPGMNPIPPSGYDYDSVTDMLTRTAPGIKNRLNEGDSEGGMSDILRAAIGALTGIGTGLMAGRGNQPSAEENALMEQARQLQALQQKRIEYQNPLFESVSQLAMSRLPTAQQRQMKGGL